MEFRGLLFDLDGTLLDTNELIIQSFQHTFSSHYKRTVSHEELFPYFGKPLRAAMEALGDGSDAEELIKTYREFNHQHHDTLTTVFDGVEATLEALWQQDVNMAVVTSKTKETALRGLRLFNLDKYFPIVIGCNECENHKPHPEPVIKALANLGLPAQACLMIGDSPFDLISATAAGVRTAAVKWTRVSWPAVLEAKPDYIVYRFDDLLSLQQQQSV